jgi:hypothetical protein
MQAVASRRRPPAEARARAGRPFRLADRARLGRKVMGKDELAHTRALGDAPDLRHISV